MEMWEIEGGLPLRGEVRVARAKNAVLPQMAAALLTEEPVRILDAPELTDVGRMAQMLIDLGGTVRSEGGALRRGDAGAAGRVPDRRASHRHPSERL